MYPSEPVEGNAGTTHGDNKKTNAQYIIEMFKAWNKMHDPKTDSIIKPWNYAIGFAPRTFDIMSNATFVGLGGAFSAYNSIPISPVVGN